MKIELTTNNSLACLKLEDGQLKLEFNFTDRELEELEYFLVNLSHEIMLYKRQQGDINEL